MGLLGGALYMWGIWGEPCADPFKWGWGGGTPMQTPPPLNGRCWGRGATVQTPLKWGMLGGGTLMKPPPAMRPL